MSIWESRAEPEPLERSGTLVLIRSFQSCPFTAMHKQQSKNCQVGSPEAQLAGASCTCSPSIICSSRAWETSQMICQVKPRKQNKTK